MAKKKAQQTSEDSFRSEPEPGKKDYKVSAEEFVRVWQESASADEVANRLNMPKPIIFARASGYRQSGVNLKKMPRHKNKALDVEALNKIIDEIDREQAAKK